MHKCTEHVSEVHNHTSRSDGGVAMAVVLKSADNLSCGVMINIALFLLLNQGKNMHALEQKHFLLLNWIPFLYNTCTG